MITYLIVLLVSFFLITYLLKVFRKPFYSLAESSLSVVDSLMSNMEEDEKVKLVQKHINKLLVAFLLSFLVVFLSFGAGVVVIAVYSILKNILYNSLDFTSLWPIISISIGSTLGFLVPIKQKNKSSYSDLSQLLHRMALNNYSLAYKLFRLEAKKLHKKEIFEQNKFVIVSGLARSGTTSLMNKLSESDLFASLSYANMPFLTSPNIWGKIYKPDNSKKQERSHKDGIMIGLDSNEALEEYFFKVVSDDSYIKEDKILEYSVAEEQYSDYIRYQAVVRNENQKIYLAKNNNFVLRYNSIRKLNKEFVMIFMFRDPLIHAASLLEKHKDYILLQQKDSFVLEYMNWLGHHEFGLNQKPFQFNDKNQNYIADKNSLDYWLQIWINYYSYILTIDKTGVVYVDYDIYCEKPKELLDNIFQRIGINIELPQVTPYHNNRKVEFDCSEELKLKAYSLYNQLKILV